MALIDSVYHYYLSAYGNSTASRYDTHKKSELRNIYNSMVKINKDSPLYKIKKSEDVSRFLIDIKESSRQIKNVVSSLSEHESGLESAFQKKVAMSSDEDIVSASYIGNSNADTSQSFDIEVRQLARPQSNLGNFLKYNALDIKPGDYSFDLTTTANSYEFQFTVRSSDTNSTIQEKLAQLINGADIGLDAEVVTDDKNRSALKITSKQTGINEADSLLFEIKPNASSDSINAMNILGIHQVSTPAANSSFILNGVEHSSYANTFTINQLFDVTLHGISPEHIPAQIGFKTSIDSVADNLQELVDSYNDFIKIGERYSSSQQGDRLLHDLRSVSYSYKNDLESVGMVVDPNGAVSLDRDLLSNALDTENPDETFSVLNSFKNSLYIKANSASLDPIKYVDKTIIAYKRPGNNFPSPYYASIYSGMMMDLYC